MNKKKTLTLQDIADELGITKMTVSRYFREPERVAKATRERIAAPWGSVWPPGSGSVHRF